MSTKVIMEAISRETRVMGSREGLGSSKPIGLKAGMYGVKDGTKIGAGFLTKEQW